MPYPTIVTDADAANDRVNQFRDFTKTLPDPVQAQTDANVAAFQQHTASLGTPKPPPDQPVGAPISTSTGTPHSGDINGWRQWVSSQLGPQADPNLVNAILSGGYAESGLDPTRVQQGGGGRGLFQFDVNGGMGTGLSNAQLYDPAYQASKILPRYVDAWNRAPSNLTGADKAAWVAVQAERPDDSQGQASANYRAAYNQVVRNVGQSDQSGYVGDSSASNSAATSPNSAIPGTMGAPGAVSDAALQHGGGAALDPSTTPTNQGSSPNDDLKAFSQYVSTLGEPGSATPAQQAPYNDMAGVDTTPKLSLTDAPTLPASLESGGGFDPLGMARHAIDGIGNLFPSDSTPSPRRSFSIAGYDDMAGATSTPGQQGLSSTYGQPEGIQAAGTPGFRLLPGNQPLTDIGNAAKNWVQEGQQQQGYAYTPTLGTRADQPARSQPLGGGPLGRSYTPEQLQAQQEGTLNAVIGATNLEAEGPGLTTRFFHGTGSDFPRPTADKFDPYGLYGPGYYLTSDARVAASGDIARPGYAESRARSANPGNLAFWQGQVANAEKVIKDTATSAADREKILNFGLPHFRNMVQEAQSESLTGAQVRAVNVPNNLKLFDVSGPLATDKLRDVVANTISEISKVGARDEVLVADEYGQEHAVPGPSTQDVIDTFLRQVNGHIANNDDLYKIIADSVEGSKTTANKILQDSGYDGIRYDGGKRVPMLDSAGAPIEHTAVVIFPNDQSLGKLTNAISGTRFGSPPAVGGAIVGGLAGAQQGDTPEERAKNALIWGALGATGVHVLSGGKLGASLEDVSKPTSAASPYLTGVEKDNALKTIGQIKDQLNTYGVIDNPELSGRLQRTLDYLQSKIEPEAPPPPPAPLPPSTDLMGDTRKLVNSLQAQLDQAKLVGDKQLTADLQTHMASAKKLLTTLEMRDLDAKIAAQNAKGGPVAGRGPGATTTPLGTPVENARDAVTAATTADGKRLPIWMQPVSKVLSEDRPLTLPGPPTEGPLAERPAGALPSGKVPGGLYDARSKPLTVEPAGLASQRALATPTQRWSTRFGQLADQVVRESYDRLYPLRELDQLAGRGANTGSHATAQVVSGAITAGEDNVRRFVMPHIEEVGKDGPALERYWMLQASRDVLAKYPNSRLPGGIDGLGGIQREEGLLKTQLGPERFAKVQDAAKNLWSANDDLRLKPMLAEGIISKEQYANLKNQYPHYLPFDRYNYTADDPAHLLPRTSENLSVANSGIGKRTEGGSTIGLDNPMARWMGDIINTQVVISRNKAARSIVEALQDIEKSTGQKLTVVAPEGPAGTAKLATSTIDRGAISYFDPKNPGVKMVANVPKLYETVAKGLEGETGNAFTGLMRALATPLRVGSTSLNIGFLPVNIIRDFQNAYFREGISPVSPFYWQGLKAALAKNADFSNAAAAGALQSGLLESNRSRDVLQRARDLQPIQVNSVKDAILALPRLAAAVPSEIIKANEVAEQAPRIATYLKVRSQGLSDLEAAVRARDVTVDFSKSGNFVRMLNQMVPFLNARLQGGVNLIRTAKDSPGQAALHALPLIFPSVAAWAWNQRFPSSNLIPTYEHDRNYVFQIGETTQNVDPRNPNAPLQRMPIYIKIPKGDASAVLTAPVDAILRMAFHQNDRGVVDNFLHAGQAALQGLAPIDPNANSLMSTLVPPLANTGMAIQSNYDFFRGRDIVPQAEQGRPAEQQFGPETSKIADGLGQEFHASPRLIDFAIRNYTGGLGQNAEWLFDLGLGALGYNPQAPGQANRQVPTPIEQAATLPVASRFIGARNTEAIRAGAQNLNEAVDQTRRTLYENPEVKRFGISINPVSSTISYDGQQIPLTSEEQTQFQSALGQQMKKDLDALPQRDAYRNLKTDALKRRAIQTVMDHSRQIVEYQMLHDIGPREIGTRLQKAS